MPRGVYIKTQEHKRKISESEKGKYVSEETRKKISKIQKSRKRFPLSQNTKEKISNILKGKKRPPFSKKWRQKMSESHRGNKCHFWKGGKSFEPYSIDWTETLRRAIRERDHYICQLCQQYGNIVHHIDYDKKNCNSENLVTLCHKCHTKTNNNRNYWINYFNS